MTALNKQALRGQSVEGSYYMAECGHCGEMYPSNKLDGGSRYFQAITVNASATSVALMILILQITGLVVLRP